MATVISNDSLEKYSVDKYNFKVIALGSNDEKKDVSQAEDSSEEKSTPVFTPDNNPQARATDVDSSALSTGSKDSLIESLMKKTDEMSSNFIKLQMKLEEKEVEHQRALQELQEKAFAEGVEAGKLQVAENDDKSISKVLEQLSSSVQTLDKEASLFKSSLEALKNELIFAALDISKEVIKVELSENSIAVARLLANELISDLQGAAKITLKVNPADHGKLSEDIGKLEHVDIISDSAVSLGGVIAISDAGNVDAQISKRFERVKKAALNE